MAYLSSQLQTLEHGNSEFIPAFQMSIDMASTYCMQTPSVHARVFYVNKIIILEVHKAKMNWLQASIGYKRDPAEGDSRKDRNRHY